MKEKIYIFLVIIISLFIIYNLVYLKIDITDYNEYYDTVNYELANKNTANLINANTISNLPDVNIITTNEDINIIQSCLQNPIKLDIYKENININDYYTLCYATCGNSGEVVIISDTDEYYFSNIKLDSGVWCMINPPNCNTKTSMIVSTISGSACKSKYPRLFNNDGFGIVACNNNEIFHNDNILWDNKNNEKVNVNTISLQHEDELLPNGQYRFTCKYGNDENLNKIIPHPIDRLQPIHDKCISGVYAASYSAHTEFTNNNNSYICNCGDFNETRLKNQNDDIKQPCTSCIDKIEENGNFHIYSIPYNCYILNTSYNKLINKNPCGTSKFTQIGNECDMFTLNILQSDTFHSEENSYIHDLRIMPLYQSFSEQYNEIETEVIAQQVIL